MLNVRRTWAAAVWLALACAVAIAVSPVTLLAERQLSWDVLDVAAHLDGDGTLDVVETQTMVFTGDWNGGERTFNLRPRQRLVLVGMERIEPARGQRNRLTEDSSLDDVDDYALADGHTLRWRSRRPADPAFANTRIVYAIHYRLSGILLKDAEQYVLDHDFAFPDRVGRIARFSLRLTFDDVWEAASEVQPSYDAGPLEPGRSFVLTVPLRYTGAGSPAANDTKRPAEVVAGVSAVLGMLGLSIVAFRTTMGDPVLPFSSLVKLPR
jgi:hypothetical protein